MNPPLHLLFGFFQKPFHIFDIDIRKLASFPPLQKMSNFRIPAYPAHGRDRGRQAGKCQIKSKVQRLTTDDHVSYTFLNWCFGIHLKFELCHLKLTLNNLVPCIGNGFVNPISGCVFRIIKPDLSFCKINLNILDPIHLTEGFRHRHHTMLATHSLYFQNGNHFIFLPFIRLYSEIPAYRQAGAIRIPNLDYAQSIYLEIALWKSFRVSPCLVPGSF